MVIDLAHLRETWPVLGKKVCVVGWQRMVAVRLLPIAGARAGAQVWRSRGKVFATIAVKATFEPSPTGALLLVEAADDLVQRDEHWEQNPTRSLRDCSDLAPYLGSGEVILRGSAHVPGGSRSVVRLTVARAGASLVDKRIVVRADDLPAGRAVSIPITYENALGGPGHRQNPVGRSTPLFIDPIDPANAGSFGPIARIWHARASLLRPEHKKALQGRVWTLDEGFVADFFHAAPPNQRIAGFFAGDETIALDGFGPRGGRVEWKLSGARAEARRMHEEGAATPIALHADLLRIDTDRERVTLTWRGYFPIEEGVDGVVVAAGVAPRGVEIAWPAVLPADDEKAATSEPAGGASAPIALNETGILHMDGLAAPTLPFAERDDEELGTEATKPTSNVPGAPWARAEPAPAAPRARPGQKKTLHEGDMRVDELLTAASAAAAPPRVTAPPVVREPRQEIREKSSPALDTGVVIVGPGLGAELLAALADELKPR